MKGREWYQEDGTAEEYDEWRFSKGGELVDTGEKDALFDLVGDIEGKEVFELACGTGRFSVELAGQGADVVAGDISREMLEQGVDKAAAISIDEGRPEFLRVDGSRLPFPDDSFDIAVAMRFFHLVPEPTPYLQELVRVSRGPVVFDVFRSPSARLLYNRFLPMGSHLYSDTDVREFVTDAGADVVDHDTDFLVPFGLYRSIPKSIAKGFRAADSALQPAGDNLGSVGYWMVE